MSCGKMKISTIGPKPVNSQLFQKLHEDCIIETPFLEHHIIIDYMRKCIYLGMEKLSEKSFLYDFSQVKETRDCYSFLKNTML